MGREAYILARHHPHLVRGPGRISRSGFVVSRGRWSWARWQIRARQVTWSGERRMPHP